MSNHRSMLPSLAGVLVLAGCATTDDRGAVAGRAVVDAATGIAYYAAMENCHRLSPIPARDACLSRIRESHAASAPKPAPKEKFEDLDDYLAKRE